MTTIIFQTVELPLIMFFIRSTELLMELEQMSLGDRPKTPIYTFKRFKNQFKTAPKLALTIELYWESGTTEMKYCPHMLV